MAANASVSITGQAPNQVISFDIPQGPRGPQGLQGPKGDAGAQGTAGIDGMPTGTTSQYWRGDKTWQTLDKTATGLANVDNTSDANKPVSTAQQTALNLKANAASPTFTGTVSGVTKAHVGLGNVDNTSDINKPISTAEQNALNLKANLASPTFTGTVGGITKAMVGLGNVDNTTDATKPVSTPQQTALNLKANLASPTFTGTVGGITKAMVGLGNVDNTTDLAKPVSTAQQTALNLKYDRINYIDTEIVVEPTRVYGQSGTQMNLPSHITNPQFQATHPSVVFRPEGFGPQKFTYWMAYTPYPAASDINEDPCVAASIDGINWVVPTGHTNPLDNAPGTPQYNSDTEIAWGPEGHLYVFWRYLDETLGTLGEKLYYRKSADGFTWGPKTLVYAASTTTRRLLSPTLLFEDNKWTMWAVDIATSPHKIVRLRSVGTTPDAGSADGTNTNWTAPVNAAYWQGQPYQTGKTPWHVHVTKYGGRYFMLVNDNSAGTPGDTKGELVFMESSDGLTWNSGINGTLPISLAGQYDALYRGCMIPGVERGVFGFRVWYGAWLKGSPQVWRIYRTFIHDGVHTQSGSFTDSLPAGSTSSASFKTVRVNFTRPFKGTPTVNAHATGGGVHLGIRNISSTGFDVGMDNWTTASQTGVVVNWDATEPVI